MQYAPSTDLWLPQQILLRDICLAQYKNWLLVFCVKYSWSGLQVQGVPKKPERS